MFELGGMVVIHDGGGCTGNFTGYDEPRWYGSSSAILSSELREIDAVVGDDEKLLEKLENAICILHPRFAAIVGSPAPMIIGTDYRALADILSRRTGIPILAFDTNGINYYDDGASMAFLELARQFVKPSSNSIKAGVNIIGATPLDIGDSQQMRKLTSLLCDTGCRVVSCWAMGSTLDDIMQSAQAQLNIVVSGAGLEAARYMEQKHGIPYLVDIPIGCASSYRFTSTIRLLFELTGKLDISRSVGDPVGDVLNALVIGEQVMSNAVRDCLHMDMGVDDVTVVSFFSMDRALSEEDDMHLDCEDALTALTGKNQYDVIIGDPLYRPLAAQSEKSHFVAFPHAALSSRLYWDDNFDYIGEAGLRYFEGEVRKIGKLTLSTGSISQ